MRIRFFLGNPAPSPMVISWTAMERLSREGMHMTLATVTKVPTPPRTASTGHVRSYFLTGDKDWFLKRVQAPNCRDWIIRSARST